MSFEEGAGPLSGLRILAIEQFGAGPFCSLFFADAGADVIKIEDPGSGGDVGRSVPPVENGDSSLYFETFNRGKRSIALDLKNPGGRAVFERLVQGADAVFNNLRGDQPDRLGLTFASLGEINSQIVCVSLSAYGRHGKRAAEPGYDALVQAEAGWAAMTGEPSGPPIKSGLPLVDYATGLAAAFGMMAAIYDAKRTGRGRDVDTSLFDVALSLLSYPATWFLSAGIGSERQPMSAHPSIVPFQFFATADGHVAVACAKEKFFERLVEVVGLHEVASEPRFTGFSGRRENRAELLRILEERFREKTTVVWIELLRGSVPCAPVRSMEEALDIELLKERGLHVEYEHPTLGSVAMVGSPITFAGQIVDHRPGPFMDHDRNDLLAELGLDLAQIEALEAQGAFGKQPAAYSADSGSEARS